MKTTSIKGKEYIEVSERLKYFRKNYKNWSLESDIISLENGVVVIKATIKDENQILKATGLAYEKENSSFINKTSYIENCETSAWGRALANLGIGIDTSVASAEEVQNAILNQSDEIVKQIAKENDNPINIDEYIKDIKAINDIADLRTYYKKNLEIIKQNDTLDTAFQARAKEIKEAV